MSYSIPVFACQIVREGRVRVDERIINNPSVAAAILWEHLAGVDREHFVVLFLTTRNRVTGVHTVSMGSLDMTVVHPREVFKAAILANAAAIIVGHNHPSGDPSPSPDDVAISQKLVRGGELLGIAVLDSLVLGDEGRYVSLQETGRLG